ncbi:YdcF family protein [Chitinibacteraceae bacterium HSL-7]
MVVTSVVIKNAIAAWLLPPGLILSLMALAAILLRKRPGRARFALALAALLLYLLATPAISVWLTRPLEPAPISQTALADVDAIVVLGGGKRINAPEVAGGEDLNASSTMRVRYAAQLARISGKPILVTGGAPKGGQAEARLMARMLDELGQPATWVEARSNNTAENARYAAVLLPQSARVALVTHAWHQRRARQAFEAAGMTVVAAPTDYATLEPSLLLRWMPDAEALRRSERALHEWLGVVWQAIHSA